MPATAESGRARRGWVRIPGGGGVPGRLGRLRTPERFAAVHELLAEGAGPLECAQWTSRALNTVKRCARAERMGNRRHHPRGALRQPGPGRFAACRARTTPPGLLATTGRRGRNPPGWIATTRADMLPGFDLHPERLARSTRATLALRQRSTLDWL
ncbi:hypothetical protein AB0M48_21950 [Lentzea sp. NPDC051208]|uniref:hypothetical protein n=1 Tax=Lentzea sp. NPDC051208 TaxID=3154642 RepID=UPI0034237C96